MEVLFIFLIIVALLALLDWIALKWGYNSRHLHLGENYSEPHRDL